MVEIDDQGKKGKAAVCNTAGLKIVHELTVVVALK